MPTSPYFEIDKPRHNIVGDASDHTRFIRLTATIAPYINNGVAAAPTLGWKSPALATSTRVIAPIYGKVLAFLPNRK